MLEIRGITKKFGDILAVDDVSLRIEPGQMVGIIGRSGAGKSTLLRLINRLIDPSAGKISFCGCEITHLRGRELRLWRASCAMIFQQFNLVERMDVLTNVLIGRVAHQGFLSSMVLHFSELDRARAVRALERVDLLPQALQRAGTLSGGQQQRVAIAKALVQNPKILLADEPIASLDPANAARVMETLKAINREDGITVLVNLHTLDTARSYCERIVAMREGKVHFDGAAEELTQARVREIYGTDGLEAEVDERVTSTAIPLSRPRQPARTEAA
ncbi:phosphonate ABC transporter ATP-binding protein [Chelativorans intermedius]|uniref:Phosphonate ABC transporter ATP-binding protein n=1 Tax=Chelativorans intermedius TaxID=515947 RepID=A0ABV6D5L5_9HYPH|nr:phosphonate ABC transporter ATP-binding protein [Chelativorans intermedius]MCT8998847.1 phosphonate ABC transporter ATP-binding protein [Chelativorans intermedius]